MTIKTLTQEEKDKLKNVINAGVTALQEIVDLKESMRENVKSVCEELDIKPALVNKAISAAFKPDLQEQREKLDDVEELLHQIGK